jgi:hypothetical protein
MYIFRLWSFYCISERWGKNGVLSLTQPKIPCRDTIPLKWKEKNATLFSAKTSKNVLQNSMLNRKKVQRGGGGQ